MLRLELIMMKNKRKWCNRYCDKLTKLVGHDDIYVREAKCKYNVLKKKKCLGSQKDIY